MNNRYIVLLKITAFLFLSGLFIGAQTAHHSLLTSLHIYCIFLSFYQLCMPFLGGGFICTIPELLIYNSSSLRTEICALLAALCIAAGSYFFWPEVFFHTLISHVFYRILSTPWPYWIIILASMTCSIYGLMIKYYFETHKAIHHVVHACLSLTALALFWTLSYKEFIIALNIHS